MLCTGFPYDVHDSDADNLDNFARLIKKARAIRRDGAAALDLCYVAMGRFDGFWEMKLKPWDMAAGNLIVTEAGGRISGFDGCKLCLDSGAVLATNGRLHDAIVDNPCPWPELKYALRPYNCMFVCLAHEQCVCCPRGNL